MRQNNIKSPKFFGRPAPAWFLAMCGDGYISDGDAEYSINDLALHYSKTKSTIRNVILRNYEKIYEKEYEPKYVINNSGSTEILFKGKFLKKISSDYINKNEYIK